MSEYQHKCEKCKRPAPYTINENGQRVPFAECDMPNCDGKIRLMNE